MSFRSNDYRYAVVRNCVFRNNYGSGSAVACTGFTQTEFPQYGRVKMINCTVVGNQNRALYLSDAYATIRNCVFRNAGTEVYSASWQVPAAYNCNVEGGWPHYDGGGNIDAEPLFVDAANGDLRLQAGSPCIDAGTLDEAPDVDFAGVRRPIGEGVDIGAYEYYSADISGNGPVDAVDIQLAINAALGYDISPYDADINTDGAANSVDVQLTINAALGI